MHALFHTKPRALHIVRSIFKWCQAGWFGKYSSSSFFFNTTQTEHNSVQPYGMGSFSHLVWVVSSVPKTIRGFSYPLKTFRCDQRSFHCSNDISLFPLTKCGKYTTMVYSYDIRYPSLKRIFTLGQYRGKVPS